LWVQALRILLQYAQDGIADVEINYDSVRPKGERLKRFGGTASGHESLKEMFAQIGVVLQRERPGDRLRPVDALDIANIIGQNVVVGGVRRTAEIALGSPHDAEFYEAKRGINEGLKPLYRYMSNNSIFFEEKPSREKLHELFEVMKREGEPGFVNAEAARKRRPNFHGLNPCAEILLDSEQVCNLTTVNVMAFVQDGQLDKEALLEAQRLSARIGYRMTLLNLELPSWDAKQKRDHLTGASLTGWQDAMDILGYDRRQQASLLRELRKVARDAADAYADELGQPRSLLVTSLKPEGTLSQVAGGVSSGVHYSHSPYYIRRIRINAHDPLAQVARQLGWRMNPEIGQGFDAAHYGEVNWEDPNLRTVVIDFPIASGAKKTKYDVTAIEQLENYRMFQKYYTEHNTSITVSVRAHEWDAVEEWIWDHWDDVVAVSFLSLDEHTYQLAPYDAIDAETYEALKSAMQPFDAAILERVEQEEMEYDLGSESCEGGACPIR